MSVHIVVQVVVRERLLDVYEMAFVLPWVLKDYFWVREERLPLQVFCICTAAMIVARSHSFSP